MDNQQLSPENEWRTVIEYDHYEVNRNGDIRHKQRKQILKPRKNKGGYAYVNFNIHGHRQNFAVHRIVANAFIPNPNNYEEVNHINYDRSDNRVENLEWVTSAQNLTHAFLKEENKRSRGKEVEQWSLDGKLIKVYASVSEAASDLGCTVGAISNCCLGRSKTSQGYIWRFTESSTTRYERKPSSAVQDSSYEDEDIV